MEFVVNIITLNVPVAAKDITDDLKKPIIDNIIRLYEQERNYYQYGVLYYDTIEILDIKPGIKDGGILNDEMVFEVTIRGLFKIYINDLSYYGNVTEITSSYYTSNIYPCYKVIVVKNEEENNTIKENDVFKFTVKDMTSLFSQGKQIVIIGNEVSHGEDPGWYILPAYLTDQPYVATDKDNEILHSNYTVRNNKNYYCATCSFEKLKKGDVFISDTYSGVIADKFADFYKIIDKYVYVFYLGEANMDNENE